MHEHIKTISSLTGLALIAPSSYGIYHIYDITNPTGNAWLESEGYHLNLPKFTNQQNIGHGCADNLFSVTNDGIASSDEQLYGCTVMHMDLYNTGLKFQNQNTQAGTDVEHKDLDPKYVNFNSEVAIRKGTNGWVINTKVDNYTPTDKIYFNHLLTKYEYKENKWEKKGTTRLWGKKDSSFVEEKTSIQAVGEDASQTISTNKSRLYIKTPKQIWFNTENWIYPSTSNKNQNKPLVHSTQYAGVWLPDSQEAKWVFEEIEVWIKEKKNSQVFCKEKDGANEDKDKCFIEHTNYDWKTKSDFSEKTWDKVVEDESSWNTGANEDTDGPKTMINTIKESKGKWISLKEVCGTRWERNLDDKQKKQLRMFCINN